MLNAYMTILHYTASLLLSVAVGGVRSHRLNGSTHF